jgi:hypothetical protein
MTGPRLGTVRARLDRLPAGWAIVVVGFLVQFAVVAGRLGLTVTGGGRIRTVGSALAVGIVVAAGVAALPGVLLLVLGRLERTAATFLAVLAAAVTVVGEADPSLLVLPGALTVAAVRTWATAGLDATDLLTLDPGRFERVDPADGATDDGDGP